MLIDEIKTIKNHYIKCECQTAMIQVKRLIDYEWMNSNMPIRVTPNSQILVGQLLFMRRECLTKNIMNHYLTPYGVDL